jgi:hypothetical protein
MKKYSMETNVGIFVVSEGFLPDFTGLRGSYLANTFAKGCLNLNGRSAEIPFHRQLQKVEGGVIRLFVAET